MKPHWLTFVLLGTAMVLWAAWLVASNDHEHGRTLSPRPSVRIEPPPRSPSPASSNLDDRGGARVEGGAQPAVPSPVPAQPVRERMASRGGLDDEDSPSYPSFGSEIDGRRQGPWRTYDEFGVLLSEVNYVDNLKEGPAREWFESGMPLSSGHYSRDRHDGDYESYHHNGQILSRGQFSMGRKHGTWTQYSAAGALTSELSYELGELSGPCRYYANGQLDPVQSGVYANGKKVAEL